MSVRTHYYNSIVVSNQACANVSYTVYYAGTTTIAPCFKYSGGVTLTANPGTTDLYGNVNIYLEPGAYDVTYTDLTAPARFTPFTVEVTSRAGKFGIEGYQLENDAIDAAKVASGAITETNVYPGHVIDAAVMANAVTAPKLIDNGITAYHLGDTSKFPAVHATRSTNLSIPNATSTPITWTAEETDAAGMFTPTSATVTAGATGIYLVLCNVRWTAVSGGLRQLTIKIAGSAVAYTVVLANPYYRTSIYASTCRTITSGQAITVEGTQNSGAALNIEAGSLKVVMLGE